MGFLSDGKKKESLFCEHFKTFKNSSTEQDIHEHWDVEISLKVDVKSVKKIFRQDPFTNENYHFVEIKNVQGKLGWLYGNEVNVFAFETNDYWIIVKKEDLQKFIRETNTKIPVDSPDRALHCFYSRPGRKDIITLVKTIDLMVIALEVIEKQVDRIEHTPGDSIIPEIREKERINKILKK